MKMLTRKRAGALSRAAAMDAFPHHTAGIRTTDGEDGAIKVLMHFRRGRWQKWFGAPAEYERQYHLDSLGREVFEACDGSEPVSAIAQAFARRHKVSVPEAEIAVANYLKTLMGKGIIRMAILESERT